MGNLAARVYSPVGASAAEDLDLLVKRDLPCGQIHLPGSLFDLLLAYDRILGDAALGRVLAASHPVRVARLTEQRARRDA